MTSVSAILLIGAVALAVALLSWMGGAPVEARSPNVEITPTSTVSVLDLPSCGPVTHEDCDVNNDGALDSTDAAIVMGQFNKLVTFHPELPEFRVDINGDGAVSFIDILLSLINFGNGTVSGPNLAHDVDVSGSSTVLFRETALSLPTVGSSVTESITLGGAFAGPVRSLQIALIYPKSIISLSNIECDPTTSNFNTTLEHDSGTIIASIFDSDITPSGELISFNIVRVAEGAASIEFGRLGVSENVPPGMGHMSTKFSDKNRVTYETGYGGPVVVPLATALSIPTTTTIVYVQPGDMIQNFALGQPIFDRSEDGVVDHNDLTAVGSGGELFRATVFDEAGGVVGLLLAQGEPTPSSDVTVTVGYEISLVDPPVTSSTPSVDAALSFDVGWHDGDGIVVLTLTDADLDVGSASSSSVVYSVSDLPPGPFPLIISVLRLTVAEA